MSENNIAYETSEKNSTMSWLLTKWWFYFILFVLVVTVVVLSVLVAKYYGDSKKTFEPLMTNTEYVLFNDFVAGEISVGLSYGSSDEINGAGLVRDVSPPLTKNTNSIMFVVEGTPITDPPVAIVNGITEVRLYSKKNGHQFFRNPSLNQYLIEGLNKEPLVNTPTGTISSLDFTVSNVDTEPDQNQIVNRNANFRMITPVDDQGVFRLNAIESTKGRFSSNGVRVLAGDSNVYALVWEGTYVPAQNNATYFTAKQIPTS